MRQSNLDIIEAVVLHHSGGRGALAASHGADRFLTITALIGALSDLTSMLKSRM